MIINYLWIMNMTPYHFAIFILLFFFNIPQTSISHGMKCWLSLGEKHKGDKETYVKMFRVMKILPRETHYQDGDAPSCPPPAFLSIDTL